MDLTGGQIIGIDEASIGLDAILVVYSVASDDNLLRSFHVHTLEYSTVSFKRWCMHFLEKLSVSVSLLAWKAAGDTDLE